ncbi:NUDIX domain-containing protein [Nocardia asteroides]|uniref:NUDIX domain-containing protein n=1 Tax=Nocardia asteroides TaxID=1824 RepID=UPI0033F5EFFB
MGCRTDYYRDPAAPQPNSLVPGGSALVVDDAGRILLQRRADSGNWSFPGGTMNLGETLEQCVVRETREETGLEVTITGLLGIYTDPAHVIAYADGEVRQEFNITFYAAVTGGRLAVSNESTAVEWIDPNDLDAMPMHDTMRLRIAHHLAGRTWLG